jgi:hypothetical protein
VSSPQIALSRIENGFCDTVILFRSPYANYTKNALKVTALLARFTDFAVRSHCVLVSFICRRVKKKERPREAGVPVCRKIT